MDKAQLRLAIEMRKANERMRGEWWRDELVTVT